MANSVVFVAVLFVAVVISQPPFACALGGSAATIAVVYGSANTICSIAAGQPAQLIQCWRNGQLLQPDFANISFDAVAGGRDILCGVRSGGFSLLCWNSNFTARRMYYNASAPLTSLAIGDTQICATTAGGNAICWRGDQQFQNVSSQFRMISSGSRFSCGILNPNNSVICWGDESYARQLQSEFANSSMAYIQVGEKHACGIDEVGFIICKGDNSQNQLNVPSNSPHQYRSLALGANHSCAIRKLDHRVVCWGGNGEFSSNITDGISFESIVAGLNFTCGLITSNFSVICWGLGWPNQLGVALPLQKTLPGPCVDTFCECNLYPESLFLCAGHGHVCMPCDDNTPIAIPPSSFSIFPSSSRGLRKDLLLAFAIVGSVGGFSGMCSLIYCLWNGIGKKKIHNSVQVTITGNSNMVSNNLSLRCSTLRRQGSNLMRRQRSGTSSSKQHVDMAEEFSFSDLAAATYNFAAENKIGSGNFGAVYKGKLPDGCEVAIKRCESKKFQEKESAFESEMAFLSRLNHKHLVSLVGYCEEEDERLLVYEYMKNGALFDHLHDKNNVEKSSSLVNCWKIRIKISLDAARGIEYLHTYAVPPIIHRDIKSSNILLDVNWTARVSDFGLSLMGPEDDHSYYQPMKAAGTVGYIDPEYYGLNVLTTKSDVYGLGVVLLELLTGKRAMFKNDEPMSVVEYAVPAIMAGEMSRILDSRVGLPEGNESEAVELLAYTAIHCVHLEGKDRPSMRDVVANLERAWTLCGASHGNISSAGMISIVSDS